MFAGGHRDLDRRHAAVDVMSLGSSKGGGGTPQAPKIHLL
jgi:hypothetical protein